jgi:RNA polymerase sigma-70 factor (ECF subfamily)
MPIPANKQSERSEGPSEDFDNLKGAGQRPDTSSWKIRNNLIMTNVTERELLALIAKGDRKAFEQIYDRYSSCLFSFARNILRDDIVAEEVLQEVFLQIWQHAGSYNPDVGKPLTWVLIITRNRAVDRIRALQKGRQLIDAVVQEQESSNEWITDSTYSLIKRETIQHVRRAVLALSADTSKAIELAFFCGLTQTEIARELDVPLGTVKARIRRGMLQLRETLDLNLLTDLLKS